MQKLSVPSSAAHVAVRWVPAAMLNFARPAGKGLATETPVNVEFDTPAAAAHGVEPIASCAEMYSEEEEEEGEEGKEDEEGEEDEGVALNRSSPGGMDTEGSTKPNPLCSRLRPRPTAASVFRRCVGECSDTSSGCSCVASSAATPARRAGVLASTDTCRPTDSSSLRKPSGRLPR
jgi:hypothetical protein